MLLQRLATGATGVKQARYRRRPTRGSEALVRACAQRNHIKPLRCGHPSIKARGSFPNGGHYRGVPLYTHVAFSRSTIVSTYWSAAVLPLKAARSYGALDLGCRIGGHIMCVSSVSVCVCACRVVRVCVRACVCVYVCVCVAY